MGCETTPKNDRAGRGLHQAAAAEGRADQGAGAALGREGRGDPGAAPAAAQMPVGAAGPQPAHRAPHHPGAGHLGRAADLPLLPRPPPGFPQVHQGREVGTGTRHPPARHTHNPPSRVGWPEGGRRRDTASPPPSRVPGEAASIVPGGGGRKRRAH